jgi:phage shock protein E
MHDVSGISVPSVSAEECKHAIDTNQSIVIVDVRTPQEYIRGNINGSINIPLDTISENILKIIPEKDKKIFVYCLSGSRSIHAVEIMKKLGYTNVFDVSHGLLAWRIQGYPLTQ